MSQTSKFHKKRLNHNQVRVLEANFDASRKLEPEQKFQLARELGVPPRQIAIWYQNKRARWKNQSLEVDYVALQIRLEAAMAEKHQLEKEVDNLRIELKRAQDILMASFSQGPTGSSLSSCCDEGAGSNEDAGRGVQYEEELYACLIQQQGEGSDGHGAPIPLGVNYD